MISVELPIAFLLYLGLFLALILGLWVRQESRARRRRVLPPPRVVVACEYCLKEYTRPFERPISRCPQCQALNRCSALNMEKKGHTL